MSKYNIEKIRKKKDNVLQELFGALPKLKNTNLKKIRKELSPEI